MARRYSRDNSGRFASAGTGATARGGRLRTAAGNKRATVTAKVSVGSQVGTIKGKVKRDPGAMLKVGQGKATTPNKKRVLVRMDARPQNLFSRTTKKSEGYGTDAKANVANARKQIEKAGATSALKSNKRSSSVASVDSRTPKQVDINASNTAWRNPRKDMIQSRRKNEFSTTSPGHYVAHELGHVRHPSSKMARSWDVQLRGKGQVYADANKVVSAKRMARRVSKYAMTQPAEFVAETRAARSLGKKYDSKVMGLYRNVTGTKLPSLKSQQQKKGASSGFVSPRAKTAKPAAAPKLSTVGAKLAARDKATGRGDRAEANIKGRFSGQAGKRMDASIDRAVKQVKAAQQARLMKPKEQVKAERAANAEAKRQAAAANPKRVRSAESLRMSRAKQVEKRRGMNISNPAGERQDSAGRMAANAARTQQRAITFLKSKPKRTP